MWAGRLDKGKAPEAETAVMTVEATEKPADKPKRTTRAKPKSVPRAKKETLPGQDDE